MKIVIDTAIIDNFKEKYDSIVIRSDLYFLKNKGNKYILYKNSINGNKVGALFNEEQIFKLVKNLKKYLQKVDKND